MTRSYKTLGDVGRALGGFRRQSQEDRKEWRRRLDALERQVKLLGAAVIYGTYILD